MNLYLHSADPAEIRAEGRLMALAGVTTPAGGRSPKGAAPWSETLARICAETAGPVHVPVTPGDPAAMLREAATLAAVSARVVVGLPPDDEGLEVARRCVSDGLAVAMLGCRTPLEALRAIHAGAQALSPPPDLFARGEAKALTLLRHLGGICRAYAPRTTLLVGPLDRPTLVVDAALGGAGVVSVTPSAWRRLAALGQTTGVVGARAATGVPGGVA